MLVYCENYSTTSESLCNYYRDKVNDYQNENDDKGNEINDNKPATCHLRVSEWIHTL